MNIAHHQGHGGIQLERPALERCRCRQRVFDHALEAEDAEVAPAGGEVGFSYFGPHSRTALLHYTFRNPYTLDSGGGDWMRSCATGVK